MHYSHPHHLKSPSFKNYFLRPLLFFISLFPYLFILTVAFTPIINSMYGFLEVKPELRQADAIVILAGGQFSRTIFGMNTYQRLHHGYTLYAEGYSDKIIVCGGVLVEGLPAIALSMRDYLIQLGVTPKSILLEKTSQNTKENLENSISILRENKLSSILLVTSSYHIHRCTKLAKKLGMSSVFPAPVLCYEKNFKNFNTRCRFIWEVFREFSAIIHHKIYGWI